MKPRDINFSRAKELLQEFLTPPAGLSTAEFLAEVGFPWTVAYFYHAVMPTYRPQSPPPASILKFFRSRLGEEKYRTVVMEILRAYGKCYGLELRSKKP